MKTKYLLSALFYLLLLKATAQFNFQQSTHGPKIGGTAYSRYDSTISTFPHNDGTNCNWDFTKLTLITQNYLHIKYVDPSLTPYKTSFPDATLSRDYGNGTFAYFKSTNNEFELLGTADNTDKSIYKDNELIYKWPINYNDTYSDSFSTLFAGTYTYSGQNQTTATAYGTLTLPDGQVFSNVLKLHQVKNTTLNYGTFTQTATVLTDLYFAPFERYSILEFSFTYLQKPGGVTDKSYQILVRYPTTVDLAEVDLRPEFKISPNPTNGRFQVKIDNSKLQECLLQVYDCEGRQMKDVQLRSSHSINSEIQIDDLPPGIYFVSVQSANSRMTKKLIVQ